ncbi:hypothetical protein FDUTEX481_07748 [Tolypothrix sp. PCC 7601]|nr:hypothetical protein FDUTEX481_07748 [Tolypothrix sp. PCC 7601]
MIKKFQKLNYSIRKGEDMEQILSLPLLALAIGYFLVGSP